MTQSKTIYGIEEHTNKEGNPEARGGILVMKTDQIPHLLDLWNFESVTIEFLDSLKLMRFFQTELAARRHIKEAEKEWPHYLKNFNLKGA